jgi:hypothetical protein
MPFTARVASVAVGVGDALEVGDENLELACEARLEDLGLGRAQQCVIAAFRLGRAAIESLNARSALRSTNRPSIN